MCTIMRLCGFIIFSYTKVDDSARQIYQSNVCLTPKKAENGLLDITVADILFHFFLTHPAGHFRTFCFLHQHVIC